DIRAEPTTAPCPSPSRRRRDIREEIAARAVCAVVLEDERPALDGVERVEDLLHEHPPDAVRVLGQTAEAVETRRGIHLPEPRGRARRRVDHAEEPLHVAGSM